jgi:excisionase family DNA binding protein
VRLSSSTTSSDQRTVNTQRDGAVTQRWRCQTEPVNRRFLTLADVSEVLNVSASQAYALVRSGELRAIKVGGRGQWRIEQTELDRFIAERYEQTEQFIAAHPFARSDETIAD